MKMSHAIRQKGDSLPKAARRARRSLDNTQRREGVFESLADASRPLQFLFFASSRLRVRFEFSSQVHWQCNQLHIAALACEACLPLTAQNPYL